MKKFLLITISIILIITTVGIFAGCNINDALAQFQKAVSGSIDSCESMDKASPTDLNTDNVALSFSSNEVMLSAEAISLADTTPTTGERIMEIVEILENISAKQAVIDLDTQEIKTQYQELKTNIKAYRAAKLTFTEEEKVLLAANIDEVIALKETINGTIGLVYVKIREARQNYTLATIDDALIMLNEAEAQMEIREVSVSRIKEIIISVNELLIGKLDAIIVEDAE